jgi:hypothetical protein
MTTLLRGALTAAVFATFATASSAATIYASSVSADGGTECTVGVQNTDRTDICNSLGMQDVDGSFSAGGFTSTANYTELTYGFGSFFTGPLTIWEVTGGGDTNPTYIEQLEFTLFNSETNATQMGTVVNVEGVGDGIDRWRVETAVAGVFDVLFVSDASDLSGGRDGFDIDAIAVSAVPLPASALLLLAGLGAFGAMRRKKSV